MDLRPDVVNAHDPLHGCLYAHVCLWKITRNLDFRLGKENKKRRHMEKRKKKEKKEREN